MATNRKRTQTSTFGAGKRESHDATPFYERFRPPTIDLSGEPTLPEPIDDTFCGDARDPDVMDRIADNSVALVVTSPPYFAGKEYEEALGEGHVPKNYLDYLQMLEDVFGQCVRKLEPGGRIAVNVANLGRKPYRSLSGDVARILERELGLLLRGEIVWQKAEGASGSTAWGSFQRATNPVLRDLTERVVVASKHRFDRALTPGQRRKLGYPHESTMWREEFMDATTDVWQMEPESAVRVGHPAPFPVELPQRLIELYTYRGDLVLDPFMGSGTTGVAALRTDRSFVGFDTDRTYVTKARERAAAERKRLERLERMAASDPSLLRARLVTLSNGGTSSDAGNGEADLFRARAVRDGQKAREVAVEVLRHCGFTVVDPDRPTKMRTGVEVSVVAGDRKGRDWFVLVSGAFTTTRPGLRRTDTIWKTLGKAATLATEKKVSPERILLLTTDLPPRGSAGAKALAQNRGGLYCDAVEMLSATGVQRLSEYAAGDVDGPVDHLLLPGRTDG